ncbi:MAG: DUF962 domain-containing protein [Gammaproteobacteria bacterium]
MRTAEQWLDEYGESHRNATNKLLHWVCVPLIVLSLVGLLWSIPVPQAFEDISPALNWATAFLMAAVVYYFVLSTSLAIGMVPVLAAIVLIVIWLDSLEPPLWLISAAIFAAAWVGQFIGHAIEGKRPSFFKDIQFLMIGPAWLLSALYRRLGISY